MRWGRLAGIAGSAALGALFVDRCAAQTAMPAGIVRGGFVSSAGSAASGELVVRGSGGALYSCFYDSRTYVERTGERIQVTQLSGGERIEVLADRKFESANCYTRMVQAVNPHPLRRVDRIAVRPVDARAFRGELAFGGMIAGRAEGILTVLTRAGRIQLRLRPDTRFLGGGLRLDPGQAPVNAHVFIRAGRDMYGVLEAFQVIWGSMVSVE